MRPLELVLEREDLPLKEFDAVTDARELALEERRDVAPHRLGVLDAGKQVALRFLRAGQARSAGRQSRPQGPLVLVQEELEGEEAVVVVPGGFEGVVVRVNHGRISGWSWWAHRRRGGCGPYGKVRSAPFAPSMKTMIRGRSSKTCYSDFPQIQG
jgi:hypothetical protein